MAKIDRLGKKIMKREIKGKDSSRLQEKYDKALLKKTGCKSNYKKEGYLNKMGKVAPSLSFSQVYLSLP